MWPEVGAPREVNPNLHPLFAMEDQFALAICEVLAQREGQALL